MVPRSGYGMIELVLGLALFTMSALSFAAAIAAGYSWYQESRLRNQAITIMDECLMYGWTTGKIPPDAVQKPFALEVRANSIMISSVEGVVLDRSSLDCQTLTLKWQSPMGAQQLCANGVFKARR